MSLAPAPERATPQREATTPPGTAGRLRSLRPLLLAACLLALLLRLGSAPQVFAESRVRLDGPDAYYHLRRALLTLADFPHVPYHDPFIGPPEGGLIQWGPLFDLSVATLARLYPAPPVTALEAVGARLPVVLGLAQVLLAAALARRLAGGAAGVAAAFLAAVLPAVVRFTLVGALDHDPAVEALLLVVLLALARLLDRRDGPSFSLAVVVAAGGLAALPLTWTGSELQLGLVGLALFGAWAGGGVAAAARAGAALGVAAAIAALVVAPFAAASPWSRMSDGGFAGLTWLHVAVLAGLGIGGCAFALAGASALRPGERRAAGVAAALQLLALIALAPRVLAPLAAGLGYAGRQDPFLAVAAESRPLLRLFGPLDPRPALVRLSGLPLLLPLLLARARPRRDAAMGLAVAWFAGALVLALIQARYAHTAAIALAVLGGLLWERLPRRPLRAAMAVSLLPCLAAYVAVPGFDGLRLYGRLDELVTTGMTEVSAFLAVAAPPPPAWLDPHGEATGTVLAPWGYGHWIHWRARRPTLANPLGPYGQRRGFEDGIGFWLLTDPRQARDLLVRHRVRWIVAPTQPQPPWALAPLAGEDARLWRRDLEAAGGARFMRSMGGRLAWPAADGQPSDLSFVRQVYVSPASRRLPDGSLEPLLRVYEVAPGPASAAVTAPGRAPSGP